MGGGRKSGDPASIGAEMMRVYHALVYLGGKVAVPPASPRSRREKLGPHEKMGHGNARAGKTFRKTKKARAQKNYRLRHRPARSFFRTAMWEASFVSNPQRYSPGHEMCKKLADTRIYLPAFMLRKIFYPRGRGFKEHHGTGRYPAFNLPYRQTRQTRHRTCGNGPPPDWDMPVRKHHMAEWHLP